MTATAAICEAFLRGEILSIKTAFDRFGVSNLPREVGRSIERKFGVHISKVRMEGLSRYKVPCSWYEYRLNPTIPDNSIGIQKMREYVQKQKATIVPKTDNEVKRFKQMNLL